MIIKYIHTHTHTHTHTHEKLSRVVNFIFTPMRKVWTAANDDISYSLWDFKSFNNSSTERETVHVPLYLKKTRKHVKTRITKQK
jgi:hypothetical protein